MAEKPSLELDPEDRKLVVLARSTRARTQAPVGASVRDRDGRTYAAADVALPSLQIGELDLAVAMAVSSGATGLEAAALVVDGTVPDLGAVRDLAGEGVAVLVADPRGTVTEVLRT